MPEYWRCMGVTTLTIAWMLNQSWKWNNNSSEVAYNTLIKYLLRNTTHVMDEHHVSACLDKYAISTENKLNPLQTWNEFVSKINPFLGSEGEGNYATAIYALDGWFRGKLPCFSS